MNRQRLDRSGASRGQLAMLLRDRRASVAVVFAVCLLPLLITISVAVDYSRLMDGRAALQRAADNAALSGAASYAVNAQAAQTKATVSATSVFCEMTIKMPAGTALTGSGTQTCPGLSAGPTVTTQIAGFVPGKPGTTASSCSATQPVVTGVTCGFIVTVSAQFTMSTILPSIFGLTKTLGVTAIAANPFLNLGNAMSAQVLGGAYNTNSVWVYPLLLDANGNPDFTTNPGAIPGLASGFFPADASPSGCASQSSCGAGGTAASVNCAGNTSQSACISPAPAGCTDSPSQFTCGVFTMLADTYYTSNCTVSAPCYPNGVGNYPQIINGVIQQPQAPPAIITATTPIGIAFQSIAGGTHSYGYGPTLGNGCSLPGGAIYTTVAQVFADSSNTYPGTNGIDWPKVTHWFYSSYLANNYPPSEGEILSQANPIKNAQGQNYNTRVPTVGQGASGTFSPTPAKCDANQSNGVPYDDFIMTSYPATGADNGSLFILEQPAGSPYILPANTGYAYQYFTPAGTPGYQYAALSCQAYGNNIFTFYWNDMGGSGFDDLDYGNGTVRIACSGPSFVLLIG